MVRLAKEWQLTALLGIAVGGFEVARGQVHHRRHVEGVGVLPRHLDVVGQRGKQLEAASGGRGSAVQLPVREPHGGQLVERGALQAGVAHPLGQVDGAFGELESRRVEQLTLDGGDGQNGRLHMGITAAQGSGLGHQGMVLAGWRQLGQDARCVGEHLGCVRELDGGAMWVSGPAGRLGSGAVQPDRLVARVPAPSHRRGEVQRLSGVTGIGRKRGRLLVPLLRLARPSPGVGESCQAYGELVGVGPALGLAGRPTEPGPQVVGDFVEPGACTRLVLQSSGGRPAPAQVAAARVVFLADVDHPLRRRTAGSSPASGNASRRGRASPSSRLWSARRASAPATSPGMPAARMPGDRGRRADVNGAANTDARRSTTWSFSASRPKLQSRAERTDRCRSSSRGPPASRAEPVGQARLQAVEPEGRQPRRGQLDRQGDPVELAADRRDPAPVVWVRRRPARHTGPLDEQRHRVTVAFACASSSDSPGTGYTYSKGSRNRARLVARTVVLGQPVSSRSTKAVTPSTRCSQLSSTTSASAAASLATTVSVGDRPGCSPNPKAFATAAPTIAGIGHRHQVDVPRAIRVLVGDVGRHGQREPGLAHSAGADRRDQPVPGQDLGERGPFGRPAHERRQRRRQRRSCAIRAAASRSLGLEGGGQVGERPAVGHAKLAQQRRDVALDRADRDEQPARDLGVAQVLAHQRQHLGLDARRRRRRSAARTGSWHRPGSVPDPWRIRGRHGRHADTIRPTRLLRRNAARRLQVLDVRG